ncbi:TUDOR-SN protein 1 [Actinidia rufa]|uniref:TUDOR-SN protein 1 n=1 Tax=Actinidia rufa TaxID=165716 RepID=A0A7J0DPJ8_9ERIC|nr:TUDOR-SN protein 1 [Actinidia rufa]
MIPLSLSVELTSLGNWCLLASRLSVCPSVCCRNPVLVSRVSRYSFIFKPGTINGKKGITEKAKTVVIPEISSDELNGEAYTKVHAPLTSEQRLEASAGSTTEVARDPCGREVKHFTKIRVGIVLESVDKFINLIGSVCYPDGELAKDLALELIENVVEVVSGDCVVADDSVPYGCPLAKERVNLSSIRCLKIENLRRDEKPAPYAQEAKEFLRTHLIGRQVTVSIEYSRKVGMMDSQCCSWSGRFKGDGFRISVPGISS